MSSAAFFLSASGRKGLGSGCFATKRALDDAEHLGETNLG
jgi:hypothetical protein